MNRTLKQVISVLASVFILLVMYYGSYVPFNKSALYISMVQNLGNVTSLTQFETGFSASLDINSPIGQEELVRNLGNVVTNLIQGNGAQHPEVVGPLMDYLHNYYDPIIVRARGMSFGQDLYVMGATNDTAFQATHDAKYLTAAQHYFTEGLSQSSKRPQFLYGLLGIYQEQGQFQQARQTAMEILSYWPQDTTIQKYLQSNAATTTASSSVR